MAANCWTIFAISLALLATVESNRQARGLVDEAGKMWHNIFSSGMDNFQVFNFEMKKKLDSGMKIEFLESIWTFQDSSTFRLQLAGRLNFSVPGLIVWSKRWVRP